MSSAQAHRQQNVAFETEQQSDSSAHFEFATSSMFRMPSNEGLKPCDATSTRLLYASGCEVIVAHHDTLKMERRFKKHEQDITLLAVDNCSDRGIGRHVVSYDSQRTAIVWDISTGDEIARFFSHEDLIVVAWMKNGNVVFGNTNGHIIVLEPFTSRHTTIRTIDGLPITAISPAADCYTFALGFQNGNIIIALLQPTFTIVHSLDALRDFSPIRTLAWHASSSRQKSDMLAAQTRNGDTRVWSIAKFVGNHDATRVIRVLRPPSNQPGPNWLAWSKNGRIVQYCHGQCTLWDVRTKDVLCENIPLPSGVIGITIHGPTATMFILGQNNMVQQYDLTSPPVLVCDVHHPTPQSPLTPPLYMEEQAVDHQRMVQYSTSLPIDIEPISDSDNEHLSPLARFTTEMVMRDQNPGSLNTRVFAVEQTAKATKPSISTPCDRPRDSPATTQSPGHALRPFTSSSHETQSSHDSHNGTHDDVSLGSSASGYSISSHSRRRRSRQKIVRDPENRIIVELFQHTKARMNSASCLSGQFDTTNIESRRRTMIRVIFGFDGDVTDLIRDEMSRHREGSSHHILLNKWMGELEMDVLMSSSQSMTSADWMLLALSGIGGQASQKKIAYAYVERLREKSDIHTAAIIMLGMGEQDEAINIYISHKRFMEALLLSAYVYPSDWTRLVELIRKWGEWAVQHGQHNLAIRCFSCTGSDNAPSYGSPERKDKVPDKTGPISPPLSPTGIVSRGPQRSIARAAALTLVTSFEDSEGNANSFALPKSSSNLTSKYLYTPIADSALDNLNMESSSFWRTPGTRNIADTASARTATPGAYGRARLSSIGETSTDVVVDFRKMVPSMSASDEGLSQANNNTNAMHDYSASGLRPGEKVFTSNHSIDTIDKQIDRQHVGPAEWNAVTPQLPVISTQAYEEYSETSFSPSEPTSASRHPPIRTAARQNRRSSRHKSLSKSYINSYDSSDSNIDHARTQLSFTGASPTDDIASPVHKNSSLDSFVSSLETAKYRDMQHRGRENNRDVSTKVHSRTSSAHRATKVGSRHRGRSHQRGFDDSSLCSPVSPTSLHSHRTRKGSHRVKSRSKSATKRVGRDTTSESAPEIDDNLSYTTRSIAKASGDMSSGVHIHRRPSNSRNDHVIRMQVPHLEYGQSPLQGKQDKNDNRQSAIVPSSLSSDKCSSIENSALFIDNSKSELSRMTCNQRSSSDTTPTHHVMNHKLEARALQAKTGSSLDDDPTTPSTAHQARKRSVSDLKAGDLTRMRMNRQMKREAARELEDRRESLVRRPSAPLIIYPHELSPIKYGRSYSDDSTGLLPIRSQTVSPEEMRLASSRFQEPGGSPERRVLATGLPATPKAMQHPKYDPDNKLRIKPQSGFHNGISPPRPHMASLNQIANAAMESSSRPHRHTTEDVLQSLPRTTYQRAAKSIARSVSAPVPNESASTSTSTVPRHIHTFMPPSKLRTNNTFPISPISEMSTADNKTSGPLPPPPPPPPPAPPLLPQLQHLAVPPPPPPIRMQPGFKADNSKNLSQHGIDIIEVVTTDSEDEDDSSGRDYHDTKKDSKRNSKDSLSGPEKLSTAPLFIAEKERIKKQLLSASPQSITQRPAHIRSHSSADKFSLALYTLNGTHSTNTHTTPTSAVSTLSSNTLSQRFSRATERLRTASRGAITLDTFSNANAISPGGMIRRTISPPIGGKGTSISPYETLSQSVYHRGGPDADQPAGRGGFASRVPTDSSRNESGMI